MSLFLMLCTLMVVREGLAGTVPEELRFVPAKAGATPPCAKDGRHYCEDNENYPTETILTLLKTTPQEVTDLFLVRDLNEYEADRTVSGLHSYNISHKPGDLVKGQICETQYNRMEPTKVRTVNNEWRYIVNVERKRQLITFEQCVNEGADCTSYMGPSSVVGCCFQATSPINLLALHPSGEKLYSVAFDFPSCCECKLYTENTVCSKRLLSTRKI